MPSNLSELPEGCVRLTDYRPTFKPPDKFRERDRITPHLRTVIRELAAGERRWPLLVHGEEGSGKTCAGLCVLDAYGGWYMTLTKLCELLILCQKGQASWSTGHSRGVGDIWRDWGNAHVTVLDELGQRNSPSDFEYESVKRCLDEREGRPAIFTSNLDIHGLASVYDDRIASRLSGGTAVLLKGDRRVSERLRVVGV